MDDKPYITSFKTLRCTLELDIKWDKDLMRTLDEEQQYVVRLYGIKKYRGQVVGNRHGMVFTIISPRPPYI